MSWPDIACICNGAAYAQNDTLCVQMFTACIFVIFRCSSDANRCQTNVRAMSDQCSSDVRRCFLLLSAIMQLLDLAERTQSAARRALSHSTPQWSWFAHKNVMQCHRALGIHYGDICLCRTAREEPNWREVARQDPRFRHQRDRSRTATERPLTPFMAGFVALRIGEIFAVMYQGGIQHAPRARAA